MGKLKNSFKSVRVKLFLTLSVVVLLIITFLILVNNVILETFYLYSKKNTLKSVYEQVNKYYNSTYSEAQIEEKLDKEVINNNFEILIKQGERIIYSSDKYLFSSIWQMGNLTNMYIDRESSVLEASENMLIRVVKDTSSNINYLFLSAKLDNGYLMYIRIPIAFIHESVEISNRFLYLIAGVAIIIAAVIVSLVSKKFTKPILELNNIAKKMSNLDFSSKYKPTDTDDEINDLGKSINTMSEKLEKTIKQLRRTNVQLERDIEEKSKIDEMRKSFISDVSHELKTPIALIQGYSEGLLENVNTDEENRRFYAEVIIDETNKMDILVKQLLELMNLEYGKREFNNQIFDVVELEKEVLRKSTVMLEEKNIKVEFNQEQQINVFADDFYIEQVITNYVTNAIKYAKEINGQKTIKIENKVDVEKNKVRVAIFNTGDNIKEEEQLRIWNRFYKGDEARTRTDGSTGIGLSIVKAIMNNYQKDYGVVNKLDGVEFYFELNLNFD